MTLGSTQPITEMSARNVPGKGKGRPAHRADNRTAIYEPIVEKMWEPRRVRTLWASTAFYRHNFTLFFFFCHFIHFDGLFWGEEFGQSQGLYLFNIIVRRDAELGLAYRRCSVQGPVATAIGKEFYNVYTRSINWVRLDITSELYVTVAGSNKLLKSPS
jgi:hypothetical protein